MNQDEKQLKAWRQKPFIKRLTSRFPKAEVFLVGGAVRDIILNRETKDFDFVVRGISKSELEKFLKTQGRVNLVGKKFGVFKFKPNGWVGSEIDIALPRTEHSINLSGAYKDFKIKSNTKLKIEDDLGRRDFTINALAYNINEQILVDPYGGTKDLAKKIIRAVGNPNHRFKEDYSRILRAIRFACQLNFEIEQKTFQAIKKNAKGLNKKQQDQLIVPREIIAKELNKSVTNDPIKTLELLEGAGILKLLIPELLRMKGCPQPKNFHSEGDVWRHTFLAIEKINSPAFKKEFANPKISNELIWGLIFHDLGKPYTIVKADRLRFNNHDTISSKLFGEIAERLKLSSAGLDIERVKQIISKHMLPTHAKIDTMKETTIEKYFFSNKFPGQELLMLIFADISATVPPSGKPDFSSYKELKGRINKLGKKNYGKKILPKQIVNGYDLIKEFRLKPGPKIGRLLEKLREAQLKGKIKNKKQGLAYIKKYL